MSPDDFTKCQRRMSHVVANSCPCRMSDFRDCPVTCHFIFGNLMSICSMLDVNLRNGYHPVTFSSQGPNLLQRTGNMVYFGNLWEIQ